MKNIIFRILKIKALMVLMLFGSSCTEELLNQQPTTELASEAFWTTEDDATTALMGAYSSIRPLFDRDYYFDGHGEYVRVSGTSSAAALNPANFNPVNYGNNFGKYYQSLYGGVNRANYVIENVTKMLPEASTISLPVLENVVGEARLLRGIIYFRLISMWGDVPYFSKIIRANSEVEDILRMPIAQIKDSIMADFTYAIEKLPNQPPAFGRVGKPAALAFRGKLQLYWACWNNFGWPELDGFTPNTAAANTAYAGAAADFKRVIEDFGLVLFRGGEPGDIDELGKAEILPNYYYLFIGRTGNKAPEVLMSFPHGILGTGQGPEELMRDFAGRQHENSQGFVTPRYELAGRYQSTITGDFVEPLVPMLPNVPNARKLPNSAINPESYANRDYRMKSSMMWDYEMSMGLTALQTEPAGWVPFIYKTWGGRVTIDGTKYTTYNTGGCNSGYVFRKFVRNYAGLHRSWGDFAWPIMRLTDVYLMYAEATNEINGPKADAIELVNRIRHRGNLPALNSEKTASKEAFFNAIEQERIIELVAEGYRGFDLRRWRALEKVWGPPYGEGKWTRDTHGNDVSRYFLNVSELTYERAYIFQIPESERERNPNLTQNKPWM